MVRLDVIFWTEYYEEIVVRDVEYEVFDEILGNLMERFYLHGGHEADTISEPDIVDQVCGVLLKHRLILRKIIAFTTVLKY